MESTRPFSRRNPERKRRPTRITIPANVSPHVRLVFAEMGRQRISYDYMEELSGCLRTTLKAWRHKNKPGIDSLCAVLGVLGFDFIPIPRAKVLPPELVADLAPIAERHGLSMPETIEALIGHVAKVHARVPEAAPSTAPDIDDIAPPTAEIAA